MSDYLKRLNANEKCVADVIPAIGMVALRWSQVETATQMILAELLRLDGGFGFAVTAHIPDRTIIDIILSVSRLYQFPTLAQPAIEAFAAAHQACRENRNLIVHAMHGESEDGIEPKKKFIQRAASRGNIKVSFFEITLDDLYRTALEIGLLAGYGQKLARHLGPPDTEGTPHTLPELFPRPGILTNTLNPLTQRDVYHERSFDVGWAALDQAT